MSRRASHKGFSLFEMTVAFGILGIVFASTIPFAGYFQKRQTLETYRQDVTQVLRRAQQRAVSGERDSAWGVNFATSSYTLYAGTSYATRNVAYDTVYPIRSGYIFGGLSDVSFQEETGLPSGSGYVTITRPEIGTKSIEISRGGAIGPPTQSPTPPFPQYTWSGSSSSSSSAIADIQFISKQYSLGTFIACRAGVQFTFDVKNLGPDPVDSIRIVDFYPPEIMFYQGFSPTPSDPVGTCIDNPSADRVECIVKKPTYPPTIAVGETITYRMLFNSATQTCPILIGENIATAGTSAIDYNQANNLSNGTRAYLDNCPVGCGGSSSAYSSIGMTGGGVAGP